MEVSKVVTPLGEIDIKLDGNPISYEVKQLEEDDWHMPIGGRYQIYIDFTPDGKRHELSCTINNKDLGQGYYNSTERIAEIDFYTPGEEIVVMISLEGETDCYDDGYIYSQYDYYELYLEDGLAFEILPDTKTSEYIFYIGWMDADLPH